MLSIALAKHYRSRKFESCKSVLYILPSRCESRTRPTQ